MRSNWSANAASASSSKSESGQAVPDPRIEAFRSRSRVEGAPATERTEIRIALRRDNLYIGAIASRQRPRRDPRPPARARRGARHRRPLHVDPGHLPRRAHRLLLRDQPAGLMGDGPAARHGGGGVNKSWDGIWEARTARGDGWSAEIRIPFRTLNFDPTRTTWGINFQRTVRRKNEEILWTGTAATRASSGGHAGPADGAARHLAGDRPRGQAVRWRAGQRAARRPAAGPAWDDAADVGWTSTTASRRACARRSR
jgi:hypothetical protein